MFAVTIEDGLCMAFPDVCNTPAPPLPNPVPIPYPNLAMPMMGDPPTVVVMVVGAPALNVASLIPMTEGDEPGLEMGLVTGEIMGEAEFVSSSLTVSFEGCPAVRLGDATTQNSDNAVGAVLMPSQCIVMVMS